MTWQTPVAYLLGFLAFSSALLMYVSQVSMLGFPDGYVTELDTAREKFAYLWIGCYLGLGFYLIYLGIDAARRAIGKRLAIAGGLFLATVICMYGIDAYFQATLRGGGGG